MNTAQELIMDGMQNRVEADAISVPVKLLGGRIMPVSIRPPAKYDGRMAELDALLRGKPQDAPKGRSENS